MTLILPWPPRELSPNARTHWSKKSRVARNYRRTCQLLAFAASMKAPPGQIRLILEFVPPDRRRRDDDNLIAAFKAGRDGLADALRVDDHRFVTTFSVSPECTPGGAVRVSIAGGSQC
ncbi:endodeoxyribonuclease RusA [Pseudomonas sp. ZM23]|uniref:Endodeoxyribonuclease RusA n=1 Tax=Pseudomonas triclosanedens TaxID=2961893 RepID=A0ABY6ZRP0_9PSED|nr:endodeoxyribonuclease RusA [Pseudomonas triclosanedens]MCP8465912.1 endodeoxyribonuclease RusA [Pseudomonas triclosanedens]MCP8472233.1 endodeoxyribonuclease RusA [Pseudomonas triclosanedens]MCP8477211.1 endodeoxyribonuclease RusA [Pseudomonas triclosanedens]WAI47451.1 endodeoxyribonuclease RusA [Pseudomonas triclosanedens]